MTKLEDIDDDRDVFVALVVVVAQIIRAVSLACAYQYILVWTMIVTVIVIVAQ